MYAFANPSAGIRYSIENKPTDNTGIALAISMTTVFMFIGCVLSMFWYIKYKPNPIKNLITRSTASKPITLTKEEIELSQINPIMKSLGENHKSLLANAVKNMTLATMKDNDHYFSEALVLYNKGIDQLMAYMKKEGNADARFQLAKKLDMYVERAKYLQSYLKNKDLMDSMNKAPAAPLIEKKCVCDANVLA